MKAIKKLLAISTMFIVGGMVNVQAKSWNFTGNASYQSWRALSGVEAKTTNTGSFGVKADLNGSADTLKFLLEYENGDNVCSVVVREGDVSHTTCSYSSSQNYAKGTRVVPWVISVTPWTGLFPISGNVNIY